MTQPTIGQLRNLTNRAGRDRLTPNEQQRLRDGIDRLCDELDRARSEANRCAEAESADIAAGSYAGRAETAERGLSRLLDLVRDFLDDSVCDLDAYGYCVAHSWACSGVRCPHARARDVLAALDGQQQADASPEPEDLTGAYQPDPPIGCLLPDHASPAEPGPAATDHVYLSTGCWHGDHAYCQSMTGLNGAKRPGECKFCQASCRCECHTGEEQPGPAATQATEPCTGQCDPTTGAYTHAVTCHDERERTGRNAGLHGWQEARLAQDGIHTPGCTCGHTGMGVSWHADDCLWRRAVVDCPGRPTPG